MAYPAARFAPAADAIGLRVPAELTRQGRPSVSAPAPSPAGLAARPGQDACSDRQGRAVELDRLVPPSGSLRIAGQQIWLGPALTGRTVRLWAGLTQVHVLLDGHRIKTLPSRLDARDLGRSKGTASRAAAAASCIRGRGRGRADRERVGQCQPRRPHRQRRAAAGRAARHPAARGPGRPRRGQRGPGPHCRLPGPPEARPRLRGVRTGTAQPPRLPEPLVVTRRVSVRGSVMVGGQKILVGLAHARKIVQVSVGPDTYQITVERHQRYRAPDCQPGHQTAQGVKLRLTTAVQQRQAVGPGCVAAPRR
jgi:hypothetical protein